jgi:hypothetical protein
VGSDAGLPASTVYRYLGLLEEVFLVKRIPAWSRNVSTRAVGTPKLAFTDSGIAANLLGADVRSLLRPGGRFGPLLEGFVLMELGRQLTWSRQRAELFHYRTKDKVEVDAVLENRQGQVVGIEVKASSTVGPDDFRGLRHLAARTGGDFLAGVVLYTVPRRCPSDRACARCRPRLCGSSEPGRHFLMYGHVIPTRPRRHVDGHRRVPPSSSRRPAAGCGRPGPAPPPSMAPPDHARPRPAADHRRRDPRRPGRDLPADPVR